VGNIPLTNGWIPPFRYIPNASWIIPRLASRPHVLYLTADIGFNKNAFVAPAAVPAPKLIHAGDTENDEEDDTTKDRCSCGCGGCKW